jgi:ankyrin repeat domain-containing protein 50
MDVGRTCPQYQEFGTLFAESKGLQRALCKYFATIIDLCKHIVLFSRKRFIAQLPNLVLPFDAAFSDMQTSLRRLSDAVRDEVALASSKHQKEESCLNADERKENARFRALATRFRDQSLAGARRTNRQYLRHLRSDFLGRLSNYNHVTTWKQSRSKGTVMWILEEDAYKEWKTVSSSRILRLVGNLGSGKTVLMANVVADLVLKSHVTVSYFFCRFDDAASLKARTVMGSLARQLLLDVEFQAPESVSNATNVDDVVEFLLNVLLRESERNNIVCLDGLDECEDSERDQILSALERLSSTPKLNLKIFYSTRADTQQVTGQLLTPCKTIFMSGVDKSVEISEYIQTSLEQRLERKQLTLGDPNLILRIREELERKADGMYLWVYFQLESLCVQTTDHDIIQTLDDLPRDMHETYTRILSRIKSRTSLARKIFEIVAVAERPLSTEELREALMVEPGKLTLKADSLINDISKAVAQCGGSLLVVDEEDSTVQFVHVSVRQFFTGGIKEEFDIAQYHIDAKQATLDFGVRCVTYLNLGVFNTQLSRAGNPASWKGISPAKIMKNSLPEDSMSTKLALSLLKGGKGANCDIAKQLERVAALVNPSTELTYAFLPYAKASVLTHTKELLDCDAELDSMFYKIFNGYLPFVPKPWSDKDGETLGGNAISWAVDHDHLGLIYRVLRSNASGRDYDGLGGTERFKNVHERVLGELLRLGFARQRMEVLRFILRSVHMERDFMRSLLFPIIACDSALLEEWKRNINLAEITIPLDSLKTGLLERYEIMLKPRMMSYYNNALQTHEINTAWDPFALAAASNNVAAIDLIKMSGEGMFGNLDAMKKIQLLQVLLRGLREAACRSHVVMFKHLLSAFPLHLYRQEESEVLDAEYDEYGWTPLHYAATLPDSTVYLTLRDECYDTKTFVDAGLTPEQIFSVANSQPRPVYDIDATKKLAIELHASVPQPEPDNAMRQEKARQTGADRSGMRLFARRRVRKPKVFEAPEVSDVSDVFEDFGGFGCFPQVQTAELSADSYSPPHNESTSSVFTDSMHCNRRQHAMAHESYLNRSKDQSSTEVYATLDPAKFLHLPPWDTTSPALQSKNFSGKETPVDWCAFDSKAYSTSAGAFRKSEVKALDGIEDVVTHPLRRVPFSDIGDKDSPNMFATSKRHSIPVPFSTYVYSLDNNNDFQAQALRGQSSALEAQTALIRASRSTANKKPWWENPLLVFLMFVLWPSIVVCCLVYMIQRPERTWHGNGQCIWDDLMDL